MNRCSDYKEMMEIDIIELLYQICRRWRGMVAAILIGAIIGCGYGFVRNSRIQDGVSTSSSADAFSAFSGESSAVTGSGSEFLDSLEMLSDGEIALADNCIREYIKFYKNYLKTNDYGNKSVYLQLDYNNVPTLTKTYLIEDYYKFKSDNGEMVTNIHNIVGMYRRMLFGSDVTNKILEKIGYDLQISQVTELYTISLMDDSILKINVTAGKWAECNRVMKILDEFVDEYTEQVQTLYDFKITPIDQIYGEYTDNAVFNAQQTQISNINTIRDNMNNASSALNNKQKAYYNAIVNEISAQVGNEVDVLDAIDIATIRKKVEADEEVKAKEFWVEQEALSEDAAYQASNAALASSSSRLSPKYTLLGAFAFLLIYCAIVTVMYILSETLRTKEDLTSVFGLMVFGQFFVLTENKHKFLKNVDSFIDGLFIRNSKNYNEDSTISIIASSIVNALKTNEKKKLYIAMGSDDKSATTLTERLSRVIGQSGIDISGCGSILNDTGAITSLAGSDAVLFVEQISKSRYEDIASKCELCGSYKKDIIGSVVIR